MNRKGVNEFFTEQAIKATNKGQEIIINRKKHFAGCLIPYYCIFGMEKDDFVEHCSEQYKVWEEDEDSIPTIFDLFKELVECGRIKKVIRIFHGKTVTVKIAEDEQTFFAFVESNPDFAFSNQVKIQSMNDCEFEIKTEYNWKSGMNLSLERK